MTVNSNVSVSDRWLPHRGVRDLRDVWCIYCLATVDASVLRHHDAGVTESTTRVLHPVDLIERTVNRSLIPALTTTTTRVRLLTAAVGHCTVSL